MFHVIIYVLKYLNIMILSRKWLNNSYAFNYKN